MADAPRLRTLGWWVDLDDVSAHLLSPAGHPICGYWMRGRVRRRRGWPRRDLPLCGICDRTAKMPWMYSDEFAPPGVAETGPAIGVEDLA